MLRAHEQRCVTLPLIILLCIVYQNLMKFNIKISSGNLQSHFNLVISEITGNLSQCLLLLALEVYSHFDTPHFCSPNDK